MSTSKPGKRFDKDLKFIFNALIAALLILALINGINPSPSKPNPNQPKVDAFAPTIQLVDASDLRPLLAPGKPLMLVIYASWCGYCRQEIPSIISLMANGHLKGVNTLFVSRDRELIPMASYLVTNGYNGVFTPYLLREGQSEPLAALLAQSGSHYDNSIPYVAFFTADGKMTAEAPGLTDKNRLLEMAHKLRQ